MALLSISLDASPTAPCRPWRAIARFAILLTTLARTTDAHIVPIPPSLCTINPLDLEAADSGVTASATEPGTALLRMVYDPNASVVHGCAVSRDAPAQCGDSPPYDFVLDASSGSIALPARFTGLMESDGDLVLDALPVSLTSGATTVTVPVTFTTGLVGAGGKVIEGTPLQGLGSWLLVATVDGEMLPPPFTGHALLLRLACLPRPVPDKDQFVPSSAVTSLKGTIGPAMIRLHATVAVGPADSAALSRGPLLLAVHLDGTTIGTATLSGGLRGRRRRVGTSDDGRTTVTARTQAAGRLALLIEMHGGDLPAPAGPDALVGLTVDTGVLLARGQRLFRSAPNSRELRRR